MTIIQLIHKIYKIACRIKNLKKRVESFEDSECCTYEGNTYNLELPEN